jgi:hypothetical protein
MVVPTTWNASPRDHKEQAGVYEMSLVGTPLAVPDQPLEILRTIHSFDPCMACAIHMVDADGNELGEVATGMNMDCEVSLKSLLFIADGLEQLIGQHGAQAVLRSAGQRASANLIEILPLTPPTAFLANPSAGAVDLVWDAPRDEVVTGYEIGWKSAADAEWQSLKIDPLTRWRMDGLEDGKPLMVRIRSERGETRSAWTAEQNCTPGAVTDSSVTSMLSRIPLWTLAKVIGFSLWSLARAKFQK